MTAPKCSDKEFIALYQAHGAGETARILGCLPRNVFSRRRRLEQAYGYPIIGPNDRPPSNSPYPKRMPFEVKDGIVLVGSDAHIWPGEIQTAMRGFIKFNAEMKPKLCILNGDVLDGAGISRHSPIMWAKPPTLLEELEAIDETLEELRDGNKKNRHIWLLGNHCMRFENKLSSQTPEMRGVKFTSLREHFPAWEFGISLWINNQVVVKHRYKGGVHATHNNTLNAGKTIVTGHLHSLKVTPFDDYNGTRWGVDTGTLSNPYGEHADYTEDNPLNHRAGFIVLTFANGQLLWPEVARVVGPGLIDFRGQLIKV